MKRVLLVIVILAAGTTVFCAFRNAAAGAKQELANQEAAWQTQTQQLAQLRLEKQQVFERLHETKQLLAAQPPSPALSQLADKILSGADLKNLSAVESEKLLAELGFNWNTTGDYLIVSKKSLKGISFDGIRGVKLTAAAREVLAVTPAEKAAIETMARQLSDARAAWAKEHVQRTEPSGNVLAQYSLPANAEFSQSQLAIFTNGIFGMLGDQRAQSFQSHAGELMQDVGIRISPEVSRIPAEMLVSSIPAFQTQPTTLTLERYQAGGEWHINFIVRQPGSSWSSTVSPQQPLPEEFRAIFPGGWKELAQREGFELPAEFKKQKVH